MAKQLNTTELDFDNIKDNIKTFFKRQDSPFKDLDFEGSGLNQILDILAYNTHYNAVNAHMAVNESFLDSAQIRSNVVSHAKLIGYVPQSKLAATASLNLTIAAGSQTGALSIPEGTSFTGKVDGVTYTFRTTATSDYVNPVDGVYTFNNIIIKEGEILEQRFVYNDLENQQFIINDENIDKTSLIVKVKENESESDDNADTYDKFSIGDNINDESKVYYIFENFGGKYQIEFGNGVLGKKPSPGAIIICEFVSTKGEDANGINVFSFGTFGGDFPIDDIQKIETASRSSGGSDRASISDIKFNAPKFFISQNRAITTDDYKAILNEQFGNIIQDIVVFGGQERTPPQYGKVFVAINPKGGEQILTQQKKTEIVDFLKNKKVITVDTELLDADLTYVFFNLFVRYNDNLTSLSPNQLQGRIEESIIDFNNNFEGFQNVFRYSQFLRSVDDTDAAVLNSLAQVFCYKKFTINKDNTQIQNVNFRFKMFGEVDQSDSFISTTPWRYNNNVYQLDDIPILNSTSKRKLRLVRINDNNIKIPTSFDAGFLFPETGLIEINPLPVDINTEIEITVRPNSYDLLSKENNIITIDLNKTSIVAGTSEITANESIIDE
jgi:hypothetical protein